jgi:tripartite-type tricarboxylate transporter receptor subunit TctC
LKRCHWLLFGTALLAAVPACGQGYPLKPIRYIVPFPPGGGQFRAWLIGQGAEPVGSSPDELAAFVKTEIVKYAKIVKDSGMRPD